MPVLIENTEDFSPELMFGCGQCFRFMPSGIGSFTGTAFGKVLTVTVTGRGAELDCSAEDYEAVWFGFFDMKTDYAAIRQKIAVNEFMRSAVEFGKGIRILRQDFWEASCSFIISQCNNIPRIRGIIEKLCGSYGDKLTEGRRSFPSAEKIAALTVESLAGIGAGYRAEYILNAARATAGGELSAQKLSGLTYEQAKKALCSVRGIGPKVADCILLYGLFRVDAFPLDVWMKRAMKEYFPPEFDHRVFGEYAGVAQQYIFHYVRHLSGKV